MIKVAKYSAHHKLVQFVENVSWVGPLSPII